MKFRCVQLTQGDLGTARVYPATARAPGHIIICQPEELESSGEYLGICGEVENKRGEKIPNGRRHYLCQVTV